MDATLCETLGLQLDTIWSMVGCIWESTEQRGRDPGHGLAWRLLSGMRRTDTLNPAGTPMPALKRGHGFPYAFSVLCQIVPLAAPASFTKDPESHSSAIYLQN